MDIQRPSNARAKKIKRIAYVTVVVLLCGGVTFALSRLKPAAPSVDGSTIWPDTVKRGPMLREVRGLGTLVPEDIHWIPAQTAARVDKIVIRPGHLVQPDTVILEMSNPELQRDVLDAEYALKAAEANYANLRVQVDSDLMNQKANQDRGGVREVPLAGQPIAGGPSQGDLRIAHEPIAVAARSRRHHRGAATGAYRRRAKRGGGDELGASG